MQVGKLLHYLSSMSTATSAEPAVAKAELLENTSGLTSYIQKLSGPEVISDVLRILLGLVVSQCMVLGLSVSQCLFVYQSVCDV